MEKKANIKGVKIRTLNLVMLAISLILYLVVLYTTIQISREYMATKTAMDNYIKWEKAERTLEIGSQYLSEQARLFARTLDKQYARNYFSELNEKRSREKAIQFLSENNLHIGHDEANCGLRKALDLSNALSFKEIYAMRLLAEGSGQDISSFPPAIRNTRLSAKDRALTPAEKIERGRNIVLGPDYLEAKQNILSALSQFLEDHISRTREEQAHQSEVLGDVLAEQRIVLIALCAINILTFSMIIILIVRPLQIYLKCIQNDKMFEIVGAYEFKHLALTYNDIFAIKEHHDQILKHKAEHDPLTGLLNRSAFDHFRQILEQDSSPVGLMLVDVDKFKDINDNYGHVIGDKTLCRVANQLKHNFRSNDLCIRMGGDEFAVILRDYSPGLEQIVCEKVTNINRDLQTPDAGLPKVSISAGIAFSQHGFSSELYNNADSALYEVKEAGRCGCRFYRGPSSS